MSTRDIGDVLGVDHKTVVMDIWPHVPCTLHASARRSSPPTGRKSLRESRKPGALGRPAAYDPSNADRRLTAATAASVANVPPLPP